MKLKSLMDKRGENFSTVARGIGVSRQAVMKWMKFKHPPKGQNVWNLAQYFKVDPAYFLSPEKNNVAKSPGNESGQPHDPDVSEIVRKYLRLTDAQKSVIRAVMDEMSPPK